MPINVLWAVPDTGSEKRDAGQMVQTLGTGNHLLVSFWTQVNGKNIEKNFHFKKTDQPQTQRIFYLYESWGLNIFVHSRLE
jgi:hypothetical protein